LLFLLCKFYVFALVQILLQEGFLFVGGMLVQGGENSVSPSFPYKCLLKNTKIFAGGGIISSHQIDFCKSLHHADVAAVGGIYVSQHGCPFAEGHIV